MAAKEKYAADGDKKIQLRKKNEDQLEQFSRKLIENTDNYMISLLNFAKNESTICDTLIQLVKIEKSYHSSCLTFCSDIESVLLDCMKSNKKIPVFNLSLEDYEKLFETSENHVIKKCCDYIIANGLETIGIFRLEGCLRDIKKLVALFDSHLEGDYLTDHDVHIVACALKLYLRTLPNSLMDNELYEKWQKVSDRLPINSQPGNLKIDKRILSLLSRLKPIHYENLKLIMSLLYQISLKFEKNSMKTNNLAILIAPNILHSHKEEHLLEISSDSFKKIFVTLIDHYEFYFFPDPLMV